MDMTTRYRRKKRSYKENKSNTILEVTDRDEQDTDEDRNNGNKTTRYTKTIAK